MKYMTAREFLRGGYRTLTDVTVVSVHGRPIFTVFPYNDAPRREVRRIEADSYSSSAETREK